MLEQEMAKVSREIMETIMELQPEEEVIVITDAEKVDVARSIAVASKSIGATVNIIIKPRLQAHGSELPESVAAAMKEADVVVDANTHAITHTEARLEASAAGARHLSLRGVTPELMIDGSINTDLRKYIS
jgi:leucyl aminopeptidase (aminopeptidase T)